jgi:hypothetical protein
LTVDCNDSYDRRGVRGFRTTALVGAAAVIATGSAAAARTAADVGVRIIAVESIPPNTIPPPIESGSTRTVQSLTFQAGVRLDNAGPDEPTVRVSFELPPGLSWGTDQPDASEGCAGTATTATCEAPTPVGVPGPVGWAWDVVASAPGNYVLRAQVLSTTSGDANLANNSATATVVVTPRAPAAVASGVTVNPRRPRAGAVVTARVRVTREGEPVIPTGVRCRARVGAASIVGTARATDGAATCTYRTRASHRRRTLVGTITFAAGERRFTRGFSVRLR